MTVRLLYGEDERGHLVHVSRASRGRACGLTCPACRSPLVAKKGSVRVAHLAHDVTERQCVGAVETVAHRLAKDIFHERRELVLPSLHLVSVFRGEELEEGWLAIPAQRVTFDVVKVEVAFPGLRVDAIGEWARGRVAIEFRVSSEVNSEKQAKLRIEQIDAVEIDLREVAKWDADRAMIARALETQAPRHWLSVPTAFAPELANSWKRWYSGREAAWLAHGVQHMKERRATWEETVRQFQEMAIRWGIKPAGQPPEG